jgi:hypothetical protein
MRVKTISHQEKEFLTENEVAERGIATKRTLQSWRYCGPQLCGHQTPNNHRATALCKGLNRLPIR